MVFFFFNDTAATEIYTLSLHDALPIYNLLIAAGEAWALASEAIAAPYRTGSQAIVYRPFVEPPIPCWLALVWLPEASAAVQRLRRRAPPGGPAGGGAHGPTQNPRGAPGAR